MNSIQKSQMIILFHICAIICSTIRIVNFPIRISFDHNHIVWDIKFSFMYTYNNGIITNV